MENLKSRGAEGGSLTTRNLVLVGGLGATTLGRLLDYRFDYIVPETYPVRAGRRDKLPGRLDARGDVLSFEFAFT